MQHESEQAKKEAGTEYADLLRLGRLERPLQVADALALRRRLHPSSVQLDLDNIESNQGASGREERNARSHRS